MFLGGGEVAGRATTSRSSFRGAPADANPESRGECSLSPDSGCCVFLLRSSGCLFSGPRGNDGGGSVPRNDCGQGPARLRRRLREQPQPEVLRDVGVLIFVDQDVLEAVLV